MITLEQKQLLADLIAMNIQEEFAIKHLTGNLSKSIKIESDGNSVKVIIDAPTYDMVEYLTNKTIVRNYKGSYANSLNEQGSQILNKKVRNHKGYVDRAISKAISMWKEMMQTNISFK